MKLDVMLLARRFDALVKRERVLVFFAVLSAILGLAFALAIDPARIKAKELRVRITDHRSQLQALRVTGEALKRQLQHDVNADVRSRLTAARTQLDALELQIKGFHQTLIPAHSMAKVMSGMLEREATVQLISLRNIAAEPLTLDGQGKTRASEGERVKADQSQGFLYKHGIELVVEGGYFELLNYLSNLEKQPWRMLWAETSLTAEYPKSRLRLKVYTLSLDPSWLSV